MSDFDTCGTARARRGRVRVSAVGARCEQRLVMRGPKRGMAICHRTATDPATPAFGSAAWGCGTQPTATTERHRQRPSEFLM